MQSVELVKLIDENRKKRLFHLAVKRAIDIIVSLVMLILLSPLFLIIYLVIKLDSKGDVIFKQERVGLNGKCFTIYKFRTMVQGADKLFDKHLNTKDIKKVVVQDKNDPRITGIGKMLRKTSLDELPQLYNIIKGDMSLIGPRPEIPAIVNMLPEYGKLRHKMRPGVSGLAQINGRSDLEIGKKIEYDIEYVKNFSIWMDFMILFKTVGIVFMRKGAY